MRRLQQVDERQRKIIEELQDQVDQLNQKQGKKRTRAQRQKNELTDEEQAVIASGKLYAFTTRIWTPKPDVMRLKYRPASNEPDQKLLGEYIQALPEVERENYNSDMVVNMVCIYPSSEYGILMCY
jgi:hypothetical protein